jgi:hypothetical protein
MARSFAITLKNASTIPMQDGSTIAKDPVRADDKGHAEVVFTVTNNTDRPVRGLARAIPLGDTKQEWVSVKGESERDFAAHAQQDFTVSFDGPVGPPPGATPATGTTPAAGKPAAPVTRNYPFRFDVESAQFPEEDFTRGPVVTVEMVDKPPPPPPWKWWIFVIIGGALVIVIILAIVLAKSCGGNEPEGEESPTPTPEESATATPPATPSPTETPTAAPVDHAALEKHCFDLVQGRIAWNYTGSTTWSPTNIQNLCRGTTQPREPPACFQRAMHGGINWGGGTQWQWQNALNLCQGTDNADATISCFQSKIAQGIGWPQAIPQCKKG